LLEEAKEEDEPALRLDLLFACRVLRFISIELLVFSLFLGIIVEYANHNSTGWSGGSSEHHGIHDSIEMF